MRIRYFFPALVFSVIASPMAAEKVSAPESFTLENGLEVVVVPNHRVPAVSHMLWLRVGAADDPPGKSGLAHYHEHMMYEGTTAYKAGEYVDLVARAGGESNAFTGYDATAYYITIAKDKLPLAMSLEADRMRGLSSNAASAKKEKEVIIEERRARIENNPSALLSEQMRAALWRNHPYQRPSIGWMHEMEKLTMADTRRFHQAWYHPNNAVLILSGDITAKEARPLVERYYGGLPSGNITKRHWTSEPPQNVERRIVMRHPNVQQPVWSRQYAAVGLGGEDTGQALPLLVLSQLLGGGKTSVLYRSLVVDRKLASSADVQYDAFTLGPSGFEIIVTPEPDVTMEAVDKAVDEELARLLEKGFDEKDIARAKALLKAQSVYARDGLSGMARIMGWIRIVGLDKEYFMQWPEKIEAVTPKQLIEVSATTWKPDNSVTGWLLPAQAKKAE
jgi:zinc protease